MPNRIILPGLVAALVVATPVRAEDVAATLTAMPTKAAANRKAKPTEAVEQAALGGASMNGSIKGLNVGLLDGESLRPDTVMMDDPQDEATASSEALVKKVVRKIDYGLRSLSGPQRRLTMMAAVTCVDIGDVSDHLLTRPGTESIRCGQVLSWPAGWTDRDSQSRAAWDEWNRVRIEGLERQDGGRAARAHYRKNRRELTRGMAVSWRHRYHVGDAERPADPDALYAAIARA